MPKNVVFGKFQNLVKIDFLVKNWNAHKIFSMIARDLKLKMLTTFGQMINLMEYWNFGNLGGLYYGLTGVNPPDFGRTWKVVQSENRRYVFVKSKLCDKIAQM